MINNKLIYFLASLFLSLPLAGAAFAAEEAKQDPAASTPAPVTPSALPSGFTGSFLAGQFAKSNGDVDDAIHYLQAAHQKDPANMEVMSQLQGMLLLQGKVSDAMALAEDMRLRINEAKDPVYSLLLTLRDIKRNNIPNARAMLDSAAQAGGNQLWMPLVGGWLDVAEHKLAKPLTLEQLTATVGKMAPLVHYHLALINDKAGFKDAATADFQAAVEDAKDPPHRIMGALLRFYETNGMPQALSPLVNAYRQANPGAPMPPDEDVPVIGNVQDGVAEVLFTMGSVMLSANSDQDAIIYLQLALYLKPEFNVAALTLGDAYAQAGYYARAQAVYAGIMPQSHFYETAQLHLAVDYDRMGKTAEALALLDKLSERLPKDSEALITAGDLLRTHERYKEAAGLYSRALGRSNNAGEDWPVYFARGTCYERLGEWGYAQRDLQQALTLKPDQPDVLNYLGYGWLERGEHTAEARALIEKAVKLRPNDPEIVDSMGWALFQSGDYAQALPYLEKAVELLPGDATVNDHLGDAYWRTGRKTEAKFQWSQALSFSPQKAEAESMQKKLQEGLPPLPGEKSAAVPMAAGDAYDKNSEEPHSSVATP